MFNRATPLLKRIILILLGLSLLIGLAPWVDTDLDGALKSFLAGADSMIPAICGMALAFIWVNLTHSIHLSHHPPYYFLLVPPPIQ